MSAERIAELEALIERERARANEAEARAEKAYQDALVVFRAVGGCRHARTERPDLAHLVMCVPETAYLWSQRVHEAEQARDASDAQVNEAWAKIAEDARDSYESLAEAIADILDDRRVAEEARDEARRTNTRLNRRLGEAQAAIAEKLDAGNPDRRTFGRALANYAATLYENALRDVLATVHPPAEAKAAFDAAVDRANQALRLRAGAA